MGTELTQIKGQSSLYTLFYIVVGFILIVAFMPVLNSLMNSLNNTNMSDLLMSDVVLLIMGMTGVFMVMLFIMGVVSDAQNRQSGF